MPSVTFSIQFGKNEGYVMNPTELFELYLFGLPRCAKDGGAPLSYEAIRQAIMGAQNGIEVECQLKLNPSISQEQKRYERVEYREFGYMLTTFPIVKPFELNGYIANVQIITYPASWLTWTHNNNQINSRKLNIVPNSGGSVMFAPGLLGSIPYVWFWNTDTLPNFFNIIYATGFDPIPQILIRAVGNIAAWAMLSMIGLVQGGIGVTSESLSFDGISQSVGNLKSQNYGQFTAQINSILQFLKELPGNLKQIKATYGGGRSAMAC